MSIIINISLLNKYTKEGKYLIELRYRVRLGGRLC